MRATPAKPDYGIDAPGVIRSLFLIGALALLASPFVPSLRLGHVIFVFRSMFLGIGAVCIAEGLLMILYARYGKLRHRDRMLHRITWRGDERVLDVGTGAGLLMIGAAKHLTTGRAFGIDPWSKVDLAGNARERTLRNAEIEGVQDKVEVLDGDATSLKFPDACFDIVVSNLCLHNIPTKAGTRSGLPGNRPRAEARRPTGGVRFHQNAPVRAGVSRLRNRARTRIYLLVEYVPAAARDHR